MNPPASDTLRSIVRQQGTVPLVVLAVALLAAANWALNPDHASRWVRSVWLLPVLWLGMTLWQWRMPGARHPDAVEDRVAVRRYIGSAIGLVVLAVGLRQIVRGALGIWVELGGPSPDFDAERRILGLATCAVFLIIGNALPKILTPLAMLPPERAALVTVARRFIGTTLVVVGLLAAVAYIRAPLPLAHSLFRWGTGVAVLAVMGGIIWMNVAATRLER